MIFYDRFNLNSTLDWWYNTAWQLKDMVQIFDWCKLISYLIFLIKFWIAPLGAKTIFTFNNPRLLAPKWFEHFTWSAPPLFILDPLLWIGSAYDFLYINSCLIINKLLMNLTSLHKHHLQYTYNMIVKTNSFVSRKIFIVAH